MMFLICIDTVLDEEDYSLKGDSTLTGSTQFEEIDFSKNSIEFEQFAFFKNLKDKSKQVEVIDACLDILEGKDLDPRKTENCKKEIEKFQKALDLIDKLGINEGLANGMKAQIKKELENNRNSINQSIKKELQTKTDETKKIVENTEDADLQDSFDIKTLFLGIIVLVALAFVMFKMNKSTNPVKEEKLNKEKLNLEEIKKENPNALVDYKLPHVKITFSEEVVVVNMPTGPQENKQALNNEIINNINKIIFLHLKINYLNTEGNTKIFLIFPLISGSRKVKMEKYEFSYDKENKNDKLEVILYKGVSSKDMQEITTDIKDTQEEKVVIFVNCFSKVATINGEKEIETNLITKIKELGCNSIKNSFGAQKKNTYVCKKNNSRSLELYLEKPFEEIFNLEKEKEEEIFQIFVDLAKNV